MKEVYELEGYELLYALLANKYDAKSSLYHLYDNRHVWEQIMDKYNGYDKRKLFNKLYQEESYNLLNLLISELANRFINEEVFLGVYNLDNRDKFFLDNISKLVDIINSEAVYEYENHLGKDNVNLTKISKNKTISLVKEILDEIDVNHEWTCIYESAIEIGKIFYLNEMSEEEIKKIVNATGFDPSEYGATIFNQSTGEIICTLLRYEGTIRDVYTTIHEVLHYINRYFDKGKNQSLLELPSIFYEFYTLDYLFKNGITDAEIEDVRSFRANGVVNGYDLIKDIIYYLELYLKNKVINKENDIGSYYSQKDTNKRKKGTIDKLIKDPFILFQVYPYILDTYLANNAIKKVNNGDKMVLDMMKYITENLSKMNNSQVFDLFGDKLWLPYNNSHKCKIRDKV